MDLKQKILDLYMRGLGRTRIARALGTSERQVRSVKKLVDPHLDQMPDGSRRFKDGSLENIKHIFGGLDPYISEVITPGTGITQENIDFYWLKKPEYSVKVHPNRVSIDYEGIIKSIVSEGSIKIHQPRIKNVGDTIIMGVMSDIHVGLCARGQYNYIWGEDELYEAIDLFIEYVKDEASKTGAVDKIVLLDLGDGLDGWGGHTTRGGNTLQQNLNSVEQFRVYVEAKVYLIKTIAELGLAKDIVVRNVCNDNHSGDFASIANIAIEKIIEASGAKINIKNYDKFMNHFVWGDYAFIVTHGKDKHHMKHGLPLNLNDKTINYINRYIAENGLGNKKIHVLKGDLHQCSQNDCREFSYHNFGSMAAPSDWVQTNFGPSKSSFSILTISKDSFTRRNVIWEHKKITSKPDEI